MKSAASEGISSLVFIRNREGEQQVTNKSQRRWKQQRARARQVETHKTRVLDKTKLAPNTEAPQVGGGRGWAAKAAGSPVTGLGEGQGQGQTEDCLKEVSVAASSPEMRRQQDIGGPTCGKCVNSETGPGGTQRKTFDCNPAAPGSRLVLPNLFLRILLFDT